MGSRLHGCMRQGTRSCNGAVAAMERIAYGGLRNQSCLHWSEDIWRQRRNKISCGFAAPTAASFSGCDVGQSARDNVVSPSPVLIAASKWPFRVKALPSPRLTRRSRSECSIWFHMQSPGHLRGRYPGDFVSCRPSVKGCYAPKQPSVCACRRFRQGGPVRAGCGPRHRRVNRG